MYLIILKWFIIYSFAIYDKNYNENCNWGLFSLVTELTPKLIELTPNILK
jgi:hypothetical protein